MRGIAIVFCALVVWVWLGTPENYIWPASAAPWERVDLSFYPDRHNLANDITILDVGGLEECRSMAQELAHEYNVPFPLVSDYECGVGFIRELSPGVRMYRITVR